MRNKQSRPAGHQPGDLLRTTLLGVTAVVLITNGLVLFQGKADASQPHAKSLGKVSAGSHAGTPSRPTGIRIPAIGVSRHLTSIHIGGDGELRAPVDYFTPAWWSEGVSPGSIGPAIIVGHVDSQKQPAVFYKLRQLKPKDSVFIPRKDGSTAVFQVDALREYSKSDFPSRLVYGATKGSTLRLITCGGRYDRKSGHYLDNVVVFAHLIKIQPKPKTVKTTTVKTTKKSPPANAPQARIVRAPKGQPQTTKESR